MTALRDSLRSRRGKVRAATLLAGVLATLAACGGGGGAKATYVEAANAVCSRSTDRVKALAPAADAVGIINRLQQLSAILRDEAEALKRLSPTGKDATTVAGMLAQLELASANLAAAATAATQRDQSGAGAALARARANNTNANRAARSYGLDRCGGDLRFSL
jgi:hypothetical protein